MIPLTQEVKAPSPAMETLFLETTQTPNRQLQGPTSQLAMILIILLAHQIASLKGFRLRILTNNHFQ